MTEQKPMTYRQIKGYIERQGWPAVHTSGDDPMPWGVDQWLNHEVIPAISKTGRYEFPSDLDLICPHTNPLKTGRYATEPIE